MPPLRVWKPKPHWLVADWLRLMESACAESCPCGQCQRPAEPGDEKCFSPDDKSFHTPTTSTTRGRKRRTSGSIPPHTVWKPQPYWVIADWLELMEPARSENCPSGQRRRPAAPGEDKFPSLYKEIFHIYTSQTTRERKNAIPPGGYRSAGCGNPNPSGWLLIG